MFLHSITILFFATILFINISAIPSPSAYQTDDGQVNNGIDNAELQEIFKRSNEYASWLYKRNSPLCDYRSQFRPLPLTSALCGYGLFDFVFLIKIYKYLFYFI